MEVEESDVRKSRGRRSRNNSSNSKDSKSDAVRETNGNEGKQSKVSNLPNGDEALSGITRNVEDSDNKGVEEEKYSASKTNPNSSSESETEKDCVTKSEATNGGEVEVESVIKQRVIVTSDNEDDFKGFESGEEDLNPGLSVVNSLIAKFESEDVISEDELDEEDRNIIQRHQGYSSDACWSATNSPHKMDVVNDAVVTDELCSSNASSPSVASGFSGDVKPRGKKSHHIDLTNPAYQKPFSFGWKRELVFRNTSDTTQKRMADVYYYTPMGKKVRSARELIDHLAGSELSEENFTFFKMPLGLNDSTKEVIRDAKRGPARDSSGTPPHKIAKVAKTPKVDGTPKIAPIVKDELTGSPKPTKNFSRGVFPRIRVTPGKVGQQPSPNRPKSLGRAKKDSLILAEGELEIGMLPPSWKEPTAVSSSSRKTPTASAPGRPSPQSAPTNWPSTNWKDNSNHTPVFRRYPLLCLERCDIQHHPKRDVKGLNHINKKLIDYRNNMKTKKEDGFVGMPVPSDNHYMQFFMQNLSIGYTALHHVFQYLKVHELLRAARVCRMWHDLAGHPSLWKTVRMKNSQVLDWDGCAAMLSRHGTQHLDLRKMLLDTSKSQAVWNQFCSAIGRISSLRHLDLCRCSASVVERVAQQCPQLTNLIALFVHDQNLDLKSLKSLSNLQELRIKGLSGLKLKSPLEVLSKMTTLRHLSLTSVKDMGKSCPEALKSLTQLESLELGECSDFGEGFGTECLPCLTKLTRLRLEMGQGKCPTFTILTSGVHSLPLLTHLELVNFDIKPGFDQALAQCTNIRRLLLIPTYLTQSATTNHMVLGGVTKLSESLVQFVWGVTHELLHVTELFMDQCEGQKGGTPKGATAGSTGTGGTGNAPQQPPAGKKSTADSIPILLPVPGRDGLGAGGENQRSKDESKPEDENKPSPQVDILPLSQLQKVLATNLPNTKISILKIPFNATWRQTLGESSH